MLTNEQCIEIAEKVHDWSITWGKDGYAKVVWMENGIRCEEFMTDEQIHDETLSWQGFGRTVEAMAERGFPCHDIIKKSVAAPEQVIELTHLAALEALKNG